jgi:hypothetical protein
VEVHPAGARHAGEARGGVVHPAGGGLGNYLWLDSQDIAGVDKKILKQVPVWILGVQREANEIKRTLDRSPRA